MNLLALLTINIVTSQTNPNHSPYVIWKAWKSTNGCGNRIPQKNIYGQKHCQKMCFDSEECVGIEYKRGCFGQDDCCSFCMDITSLQKHSFYDVYLRPDSICATINDELEEEDRKLECKSAKEDCIWENGTKDCKGCSSETNVTVCNNSERCYWNETCKKANCDSAGSKEICENNKLKEKCYWNVTCKRAKCNSAEKRKKEICEHNNLKGRCRWNEKKNKCRRRKKVPKN